MEDIDIKKKLYDIALNSKGRLLQQEVAIAATESDNPIQYLRDMYRNNGLKYDLQDDFFEFYIGDITSIIEQSEIREVWEFTAQNFKTELSFLGYQLTLEKMMIDFGMIKREAAFFAEYDILDVHTERKDTRILRYGISDIELSADVTPSKYVEVRDEQGKILTEAEVYFIEED